MHGRTRTPRREARLISETLRKPKPHTVEEQEQTRASITEGGGTLAAGGQPVLNSAAIGADRDRSHHLHLSGAMGWVGWPGCVAANPQPTASLHQGFLRAAQMGIWGWMCARACLLSQGRTTADFRSCQTVGMSWVASERGRYVRAINSQQFSHCLEHLPCTMRIQPESVFQAERALCAKALR